jgi:hypothetical protein
MHIIRQASYVTEKSIAIIQTKKKEKNGVDYSLRAKNATAPRPASAKSAPKPGEV